jgi:hypothetical protein
VAALARSPARRPHRYARRLSAIGLAVALPFASASAGASQAQVATVTVPVRLDHAFLRRIVIDEVFDQGDQSARIWDDPAGCGHLTLRDPEVRTAEARLLVRSAGEASWGVPFGERCLTLSSWDGWIELFLQPELERELPIVHFRVVDSRIFGPDGSAGAISSRLWNWIKEYVQPRFQSIIVDLHEPVQEIRALLPLVLPAEHADQASATLDSLALSAVRVEEHGLAIDLSFARPAVAPPAEGAAERPLEPAEVERWDAFLTFVIKRAAFDASEPELRNALLSVLLDGRHEIVAALTAAAPDAPDPVPALFRQSWARLAPVLRRFESALPGADAIRYLAFVSAGDALAAIDELGPGTGLEISAAGLRRLARIVAPEVGVDPLLYEAAVDPSLRERFGFGAPIPLPDPSQLAEEEPPAETPPAPQQEEPANQVDPNSWLLHLLVSDAHAEQTSVVELQRRLNGWVPAAGDLDRYLPMVRVVLDRSAAETQGTKPIPDGFQPIFRPLVLSTAWKETCWRQFVRQSGRVVPIESSAGAVGIMQVLARVWRGFYDAEALRRDIAYNARAGTEILRHYLVDYAIRKNEHKKGGSIDALARATYAAYNGGPSHLSRYRSRTPARSLGAIDAEFWRIYQQVKSGDELGVRACYGS